MKILKKLANAWVNGMKECARMQYSYYFESMK